MSEDLFVHLPPGPNGGLDVPADAYRLLSSLICRDLVLTGISGDGRTLRVTGVNGAKPDLSPEDVAGIKKYKFHLLALISYRAPERTWS